MGNGRNNNHVNNNGNTNVYGQSPGKSSWVDDSGKFSTFTSKSIGPRDYEDDGGATHAYMTSITNTEAVYNTLSRSEKSSIDDWIVGEMMRTSDLTFSQLPSYKQDIVRAMDKLVDGTTLQHGITVRSLGGYKLLSGKSRVRPADLNSMVGEIKTLTGHMSTGAASDGLTIGSSGKPVEYVISIPGGSKGAGAWIGNPKFNRVWGYKQREWVAARDSSYKITGIGHKGGRDVVYMEYVGAGKHSYK